MKYHIGQKVYVWRYDVNEEIYEATITEYSGRASFDEDVYEFVYNIDGMGALSGAGESEIFETLIAARHAKFKLLRETRQLFIQIEDIAKRNKEIMTERIAKLLPDE